MQLQAKCMMDATRYELSSAMKAVTWQEAAVTALMAQAIGRV